MAAVLAAGNDAVLSHTTAGGAWAIRPLGAGLIHVTVPGDVGRKRRQGIRIHRSRTLTPSDTTTHLGIPITTPARTIIDLASTLEPLPLEQALDQADRRGLIDFAELKNKADPTLPTSNPGPLQRPDLHPQRTRRPLPRALRHTTTCPAPSATPSSKAKKSTSPGGPNDSSSRSTATATTAHPRASRTTANATSCSPSPAGQSCASPGPKSRPAPNGSPARSPSGWPSAADLTRAREAPRWPGRPSRADTSGHGRARRSSRPCADAGRASAPDRGRRAVSAAGLLHGDRRADGQRHRHHAVAHARAADRRLPGRAAHVRVRALAGGARAPPCRARARRPDRRRLPAAARRPPPRGRG